MRVLYFYLVLFVTYLIKNCTTDTIFRGQAVHSGEVYIAFIHCRKNYPGQCYYKELHKPIPVNQTYNPVNQNLCLELYCRDDFVLQIGLCGRYMYYEQDGCQLIQDYRQQFPACCPHYECKQDVLEKFDNTI